MIFNWLRKIWYKINPKHKDRLFCVIFGKEKYKRYALELYNAVNKSHYTNLNDLEIITLEDAVYIKMKNDLAYLISGHIAVYEHQSSINNNMPIRGFMYFGELYSKILKREGRRIYNRTLVKIPTPQYIVFYNGTDKFPEMKKLKLSDAFIHPVKDGEFEFTATVYNINPGMNEELLNSCKPLKGYSTFVQRVRENEKMMPLEEAVDKAVVDCINENVLKDVLEEERSAAMLEMLTTFDEKLYAEGLREEGREEGIEIGRTEGIEIGRTEGMEIGRAKGASELATAILHLKKGDSAETLISEGFSEEIVKSAEKVLKEL